MVHNRRRGGAKDVIGKKIPVATAIPVVTAVPEKTTQKLLKRMKKGGTWMKVENWLYFRDVATESDDDGDCGVHGDDFLALGTVTTIGKLDKVQDKINHTHLISAD